MTKKDLFDGLNYIDDQIIEEAQPTGESAGYSDDIHVNKKYKDTVFRKLFGENKENALSLYNAVNGSSYTNADDLEINTLEDVVYMGMKIINV